MNLYIGRNVTDEKLEKILEIFDALSFNREYWMMTRFGAHGQDWHWEGEPYQSKALRNTEDPNTFINWNWFSTPVYAVMDRDVLYGGVNAAVDFGKSERGRTLSHFPYAEDIFHRHAERRLEIDDPYLLPLAAAADAFLGDILSGIRAADDAEWHRYLGELESLGLDRYAEYYGAVGRNQKARVP
jgi:hypothetical protein